MSLPKISKKNEKSIQGQNIIKLAIDIIPNKELKEAAKECNQNGVTVKSFYPSFSINETEYIVLIINKNNELKILNIIKSLYSAGCFNAFLLYNDKEHVESIKITANYFNKIKVFEIIKQSCKNKCNIDDLPEQAKEIYIMHKQLTNEEINHVIHYSAGNFLQSFSINNVDSFLGFESNQIKKIYSSHLWETIDNDGNSSFIYKYREKNRFLQKMRTINLSIEDEIKREEQELKNIYEKYRCNIGEGDMLNRLSKIRDENVY